LNPLGFAGLVEERKIGDDKMIFEEMQKSSFRGYTDTCLSANQVWVLGFGFWVLGFGFWVLGFGIGIGIKF
jgi:hypothetical protein